MCAKTNRCTPNITQHAITPSIEANANEEALKNPHCNTVSEQLTMRRGSWEIPD